jgi:hypothetical protein
MAHTADEHFKMILGLTVADQAAQLAIARAENEGLKEQLAALQLQISKRTPKGKTNKRARLKVPADV